MDDEKVEVGVTVIKYRVKSCAERLVASVYDHVVLPCILI